MDVKFLIAGDRAVSVEFGSVISLEVNARVRALDEKLKESPIEGMVETVPTYCALIVHYRPEVIRYSRLVEELEKRIADMHEVSTTTKKVVKEIPVYYGGETGPDLEYCAELENTTTEEIIRKHSQHEYYVYMLGFAPGHPYMARFEEPFSFKRRTLQDPLLSSWLCLILFLLSSRVDGISSEVHLLISVILQRRIRSLYVPVTG